MIFKALTAAAIVSLAGAPIAASAQAAPTVSAVKSARAATPTGKSDKILGGGAGGIAAAILGVAILGGIVYAIVDGTDENDGPDSN